MCRLETAQWILDCALWLPSAVPLSFAPLTGVFRVASSRAGLLPSLPSADRRVFSPSPSLASSLRTYKSPSKLISRLKKGGIMGFDPRRS
ncbi:uncharacterized protein BDZ99DRAFT_458657 [Mytilinidion resinicola]|uniref:Uncharacterized protein n=1 Tax=Mytilinidion resinicola TaxID=574789 RepID=A0A6A6Z0P2_9PEZI|nr:uncharacterized protein BDZ99DRAFT_458657 [Mytilinidion resinicola]KAF2814661.1 hypothetical protein BDZ99DRAFT_458657 [Mytilinidion resinicola]